MMPRRVSDPYAKTGCVNSLLALIVWAGRLLWCSISLLISLPTLAGIQVLTVQGTIGPASADYLVRGIDKANAAHTRLVVIELDTPGGLDTSMRDIIKAILASDTPVATSVSPAGARAASAGTYILYASHVAAMAPATNLGAATPVELMPAGAPGKPPDKQAEKSTPPLPDAKTNKAINDAAAYIRGLAELRGRNAAWAERAVREAKSLSAEAALQERVIDVIAIDLADLLKQLHGRKVAMGKADLTLSLAELAVTRVEQDWRTRLLAVIGEPSVAYILLLLGIYGLIYEFMSPGMLLPGVVGGICLLLALFALQLMPVNYVGLALLILGITMMVAEAFLPSFGTLGMGGIVAFVLGSVMLIDTDLPDYGVSLVLIAPLAGVSALFSFAIGALALRARQQPVLTGDESLAGSEGETLDNIAPGESGGWARIQGETWRVQSQVPLVRGTKIRVVMRHGLTLAVEPVNPQKEGNDV